MDESNLRVYVSVSTDFSEDGQMFPRIIMWKNGQKYRVDRVKSVRSARTENEEEHGDRYTVVINGAERYLYFEHGTGRENSSIGRWFIERKA